MIMPRQATGRRLQPYNYSARISHTTRLWVNVENDWNSISALSHHSCAYWLKPRCRNVNLYRFLPIFPRPTPQLNLEFPTSKQQTRSPAKISSRDIFLTNLYNSRRMVVPGVTTIHMCYSSKLLQPSLPTTLTFVSRSLNGPRRRPTKLREKDGQGRRRGRK